jgi:hypothetical protein
VLDRLYRPGPDGLCGDEDNGQTSAWYVCSALGFYPVSPSHPSYALGSPLFPRATLRLPGGKRFTIEAPGNDAKHVYVQRVRLNGKNHPNTWIAHGDITRGGTLVHEMAAQPDWKRGTGRKAVPFTMSTRNQCSPPYATFSASPHGGALRVTLGCRTPGARIRYTLDGTQPTKASALYQGPFLVPPAAVVRAVARKKGWLASPVLVGRPSASHKQ